jgi:hypothetical protein
VNSNIRSAKERISAVLIALLSSGTSTVSAGIVVPPELPMGSRYPCGHLTPGETKTLPIEWKTPDQLSSAHYATFLTDRLEQQQPAFDGDWRFKVWADATGSLEIPDYFPFDGPDACRHRAQIRVDVRDLRLNKQGVDESTVRWEWVQLYSGWDRKPGEMLSEHNVFDPPAGLSQPLSDDLPFYYDFPGRGGSRPRPSDGRFEDAPGRFVLDSLVTHEGRWEYKALLVSWDGDFSRGVEEEVFIHGRLDWGWEYECTPAPGGLFVLGLAGLCGRRRRW